MRVQILIDNKESWAVPYAYKLQEEILKRNHDCAVIFNHEDVKNGDILFLFSCERLFKYLELNKFNLVVHESKLPKGKGWSPLTWQILEGKNRIPITLFEASEKVDAGGIYSQEFIELDGSELIDEIKCKQGKATIILILGFIDNYPNNLLITQKGNETFYPKRTANDSELDISKSIDEQFNLLRVCDNERYPAFFEKNGVKYVIKIYKDEKNV